MRPQINIENNDKQSDERYQINMIDVKEYNKSDQISKNKEGTLNTDIEVLILQKIEFTEKRLSREIFWWNKSDGYERWQGIW